MQKLRRLGIVFTLMLAFAVVTLAGETNSPPCAAPGEMSTPPCPSQMVYEEPTALGQIDTPPASESTSIFSLAVQTALDLLLF